MEEWKDLFVASAGAAAALAGLIFVGVSINLTKILSLPQLPGRAAQSIILLVAILVISLLLLVPHFSFNLIGPEIFIMGLVLWIGITRTDFKNYRLTALPYKRHYFVNITLSQMSVLPYIVSGILVFLKGEDGIYWLIPGIIFSFIKAMLDAWVMLVEINR